MNRGPISFHEFKAECQALEDHAYFLSQMSCRLDSSPDLVEELSAEEFATVRALQREANCFADKVYQMLENGYRRSQDNSQKEDAAPRVPYKLPRTDGHDAPKVMMGSA